MKRVLSALLVSALCCCLASSSLGSGFSNTLKFKQKFGGSQNIYWLPRFKLLAAEFLYSSGANSSLLLALGPSFSYKRGDWVIKASNYSGIKLNTADEETYRAKSTEIDNFLVLGYQRWTIYSRFWSSLGHGKAVNAHGGREFIGFQVFSRLQIRAQSEWKLKESEFTPNFGLGLEALIREQEGRLTTAFYIGWEELGYPTEGWFEVKAKY